MCIELLPARGQHFNKRLFSMPACQQNSAAIVHSHRWPTHLLSDNGLLSRRRCCAVIPCAADVGPAGEGKKARKPRKKKDPNAPKKALSGFMFFSNSNRERIKTENPGIPFGQVRLRCMLIVTLHCCCML
jgi:hypothetical protein